jgi:CRISPR-associated protein Csd1
MLQGLVRYYERLEKTDNLAPRGYSTEGISFVLSLARNGQVVDVYDLRDHVSQKPRPKPTLVPAPPADRSGRRRVSAFLWDNSKYALGIGRYRTEIILTPDQFDEFKRFHLDSLRSAADPGLAALRSFVASWAPAKYESLQYGDELPETKIVFRLEENTSFIHESEEARRLWGQIIDNKEQDLKAGMCLVTGEIGPIARLHGDISNVTGQRNVGPLVSFNEEAFESYGKSQGANAPVSQHAAHAYATALNTLLSLAEGVDANNRRRWKNRVQVGDATTVFWAEAAAGPEAAAQAEAVFSWTLDPPIPTDEQEAAKVRSVLQKVEKGRPLAEVDELGSKLNPEARFYVLGLSPNAARLSVRFFLETDFGRVYRNLQQHLLDLSLDPPAWRNRPPAAYLLALQTAVMRQCEKRISARCLRLS